MAVIGDSYVHTFAAFSTFTALSLGTIMLYLTLLHCSALYRPSSSSIQHTKYSNYFFYLTLSPPGSTYISLKSAILPSLSIARLDVILQHHFIFEFDDLKTDRNFSSGFPIGVGCDSEVARVYSDPSPILDPAKLADMEAYLGSKPGN